MPVDANDRKDHVEAVEFRHPLHTTLSLSLNYPEFPDSCRWFLLTL